MNFELASLHDDLVHYYRSFAISLGLAGAWFVFHRVRAGWAKRRLAKRFERDGEISEEEYREYMKRVEHPGADWNSGFGWLSTAVVLGLPAIGVLLVYATKNLPHPLGLTGALIVVALCVWAFKLWRKINDPETPPVDLTEQDWFWPAAGSIAAAALIFLIVDGLVP